MCRTGETVAVGGGAELSAYTEPPAHAPVDPHAPACSAHRALTTCTSKVAVPATVGVPLMLPSTLSVSPVGRLPEASAQRLKGEAPLLEVRAPCTPPLPWTEAAMSS